MESYVDKAKVSLKPVHKGLAKDMIVRNHYSRKMSACRYTLGVFYKSDGHKFFDGETEDFIGVACYGFPVGRRVIGSIFKEDIIQNKNILELKRLFINSGLKVKDTKGFVFNPLSWGWELSKSDFTVNYAVCATK